MVLPLLPVIATTGPPEARAVTGGEGAERLRGVGDLDHAEVRLQVGGQGAAALDHEPSRAGGRRRGEEEMRIVARAGDRDEELAGAQRARIDRDAVSCVSGLPWRSTPAIHAAASPARREALIARLASRARGAPRRRR